MKSKTTCLLATVITGSLALGAWSVRTLGTPSVAAQKKGPDIHHHEEHGHRQKPNARGRRDAPKGQNTAKEGKTPGHEGHAHGEETTVRVSEAQRKELGIEVATAQPGSLQTQLSLTGTMSLNTDRSARLVSRLPGVVREVRKNLGDTVRAGEVMAVIDSRELADAKGAYLAASECVTLTAETFQREKDLWEKKISHSTQFCGKAWTPSRSLLKE